MGKTLQRTSLWALGLSVALACGAFFALGATDQAYAAQKADDAIYLNLKDGYLVCADQEDKSALETLSAQDKTDLSAAEYNSQLLNLLVDNDEPETIVLPKGTTELGGPIRPGSNTTIVATGATILVSDHNNAVWTDPKATNYQSFNNITIKGGTWKGYSSAGTTGCMFAFSHGSNLTIDGAKMTPGYKGHAIEITACKNVTVKNCTLTPVGKNPKDNKECMLQIDIATPKSSPHVAGYGSQYAQGQTCENVYILNNTIKGARGVETNWDDSAGGKFRSKFHKNVVVKNNKITGVTAEALVYYNVIGGEISGNTIVTNATQKAANRSYTIACHIAMFGKAPAAMKKSVINISKNTMKGNRNAIYIKGYANSADRIVSSFGTIKVTNNKLYCKDGKANALGQTKGSCKLVSSGNVMKKW